MSSNVLLVLLFLIAGCGSAHYSQFDSFKKDFEASALSEGRVIHTGEISLVQVDGQPEPALGGCDPSGNVTVNKVEWISASDSERRVKVYHALGHCALKQVHRQDSLMDPSMDADQFSANQSGLLDELFSHVGP